MRTTANGIEIEYEVSGDDAAPAMLLVMGLGTQMTRWPPALIETLVAEGFRVIRFDNRDVGLSTRLEEADAPDLAAVMTARLTGGTVQAAYTLADMAEDAVGLLDALGVERAHVVGASMGGMIAQLIAGHHPERVLSLTSIMSSSGNPALPGAAPAALALMAEPRPDPDDLEAILDRAVVGGETLGSPGYPIDPAIRRAAALADYRRSYYPAGVARQTAAIMASGDRREMLRTITAPALVIHGVDDPLVPVEAGRDTAASICHAELIELPGMGHDVPDALVPTIAEAIVALARRAGREAKVSREGDLT